MSLLERLKSNKIVQIIFWARWLITLVCFLSTLLWYAYVEGQDISQILSDDYRAVQAAQATLIEDSESLQSNLLNANVRVSLGDEFGSLRTKAKTTIAALGGLRAPTNAIEVAKREYRKALEQLIAVANRLERGETEDMAAPLHNSLQAVANAGGRFNAAVQKYQGGMWPQLLGSIF